MASPETRTRLLAAPGAVDASKLHALAERTAIGDAAVAVEFLPLDQVAAPAGAAVYLPGRAVLFAGPLVVHGPRAPLAGSDTATWVATLRRLEALAPAQRRARLWLVGRPRAAQPASAGSWPSSAGRSATTSARAGRTPTLGDQVALPADCFAWMPYGTPDRRRHRARLPRADRPDRPVPRPRAGRDRIPRPHALVLIGDQPHEPGHIEEGLRPVFEATGVVPHFTVDVNALSAAEPGEGPAAGDPPRRPAAPAARRSHAFHLDDARASSVRWWHSSRRAEGSSTCTTRWGCTLPNGPYLNLVGGRYIGHGPLERFRVEVVDPDHPITRGVEPFFVADEQHTPPYDEGRVHLLAAEPLRRRQDAPPPAGSASRAAAGSATWPTATPARPCSTPCISGSCATPCGGACDFHDHRGGSGTSN